MSLVTYDDARPWARAMREEVLARRMPKWHAARGYCQFANDRSLTPFEIALVVAWVDGGAIRGPQQAMQTALAQEALPPTPEGYRTRRLSCGDRTLPAGRLLAVKPQLAFFEALGSAGMAAFEQVCQYSKRAGLLVIADGKRGDIGSTARAYSEAYIEGEPPMADALTVNPWLGRDSVEPFLGAVRRGGVGIFVIVRTSNASGDLQDAVLKDGLYRHIMRRHRDVLTQPVPIEN